jgi:hypothetical protein
MQQLVVLCLIGHAQIALAAQDVTQAAQHLQGAEELRRQIGVLLTPFEHRVLIRLQQEVREQLEPQVEGPRAR